MNAKLVSFEDQIFKVIYNEATRVVLKMAPHNRKEFVREGMSKQ